jgi:hypothetical protein
MPHEKPTNPETLVENLAQFMHEESNQLLTLSWWIFVS